jgi:hypothetical protein
VIRACVTGFRERIFAIGLKRLRKKVRAAEFLLMRERFDCTRVLETRLRLSFARLTVNEWAPPN